MSRPAIIEALSLDPSNEDLSWSGDAESGQAEWRIGAMRHWQIWRSTRSRMRVSICHCSPERDAGSAQWARVKAETLQELERRCGEASDPRRLY